MSKRSRSKPVAPAKPLKPSLLEVMVKWPRLLRWLLVMGVSLISVLALFPLLDEVYLSYFYSPTTTILPSLIATAVGVVVYVVGWRNFVGMVGETPKPSATLGWYFGFASIIVIIDVILILQGLAMTDAMAG